MNSTALVQSSMDFTEEQPFYIACNPSNIKETMPKLLPHQVEDIVKIERRYQVGKGYLITHGTGVGKTYIGLGVIKRFLVQGKKEILIIVPTDQKCNDWISEGSSVGIDIYKLKSIIDSGIRVSVCTYANYYQNEAILKTDKDLIVYDESHYLNQNQKGADTSCLAKHRLVANLPTAARGKATDILGSAPRMPDNMWNLNKRPEREAFEEKKKEWARAHFEQSINLIDKTKVLFLSATPFAYHKSIRYIDGCLYDIEEHRIEKMNEAPIYNVARGFDRFLVDNFGYKMRTNKLTKPDIDVDQGLLEREFFEKMQEDGVASTRILELDVDYSRDFIKVDSEIGDIIDEGISMLHTKTFQDKYKHLGQCAIKNFTYLRINQMLECIKAQKSIERIKQHLFLGRKIIIFHTYNHAKLNSPFKFDVDVIGKEHYNLYALKKDIERFEEEYPEYLNLDLSSLINVRDAIKKEFPDALEYNGIVPKKKRRVNIENFNDQNSGFDIIVVQTKAGREGISLHDRTGEKQRVIIDFGLPVAPTQAIQQEGRSYRFGTFSNAIYEYFTLQTSFERSAFAHKIASRARTAENLAMGNLARDLETAFKEGYQNFTESPPSIWQGRGGTEKDRVLRVDSEWDKAKTYYYQRQKANKKRKSGGMDYFATPEPLGFKMIEWCELKAGDTIMEPSCGTGSISRFTPPLAELTMIENHFASASIAEINSHGKMVIGDFEEYYVGNKADHVVMNPPFGKGGKTAFEHLEKACKHLGMNGGVLYCIVPNGPAMQKRLDAWYETRDFNEKHRLVLAGEMILPSCTFERAGTRVSTKIIKLFKWGWMPQNKFNINSKNEIYARQIDLSYCDNINEFFERIEHLKF